MISHALSNDAGSRRHVGHISAIWKPTVHLFESMGAAEDGHEHASSLVQSLEKASLILFPALPLTGAVPTVLDRYERFSAANQKLAWFFQLQMKGIMAASTSVMTTNWCVCVCLALHQPTPNCGFQFLISYVLFAGSDWCRWEFTFRCNCCVRSALTAPLKTKSRCSRGTMRARDPGSCLG